MIVDGLDDRDWPFVGRRSHVERLGNLMSDPACRGVVVYGEPGVGKSRLAEHVLGEASRRGVDVATVHATETSTGIPYGALARFIPLQLAVDRPTEHGELVERIRSNLLSSLSSSRPVVFVDDAQHLDDASGSVIHQLVAANDAFVLMTVRAGERLPALVTSLWKDQLLERLDLEGLGEQSMSELVQFALAGKIDPAVLAFFVEKSQRNVLFLRELILGAVAEGTIVRRVDYWQQCAEFSPSSRLVEIIEARLRGLRPDERHTFEVVALAEPIEVTQLLKLTEMSTLEALESARLIAFSVETGPRRVNCSHPLYGEAIRASIPHFRARRIAGCLIGAFENQDSYSGDELLRIGRWCLMTEDGDAAVLLGAAAEARWRYEFGLADRLAALAIRLGGGLPAELLAAQLVGLRGDAEGATRRLTSLQLQSADEDEAFLVAIARLDHAIRARQWTDVATVSTAQLARISSAARRDEIASRATAATVAVEGPRSALGSAGPLLRTASGTAYVWAALTAAWSLTRLGRLAEAIRVTHDAFAAQGELDVEMEFASWYNVLNRCEALLFLGRLREAESVARAEIVQGLAEHSNERQACFSMMLARVLIMRGRVGAAAEVALLAVGMFENLDRPMFHQQSLQCLAFAHALAGDAESADRLLNRIDTPDMVYAVELLHSRAWAAVAAGRVEEADRYLRDAAGLGEDIGDFVGALLATYHRVRLGSSVGVSADIARVGAHVEGQLGDAIRCHVSGVCEGDATLLGRASQLFEELGSDMFAADAAARESAEWDRCGELRRARAALVRARSLAARCEGAVIPTLETASPGIPLTPAERRTALCAIRGRSNREIADDMFLSVRTIENRLQRVYAKLGISSRTDLRTALASVDSAAEVP